MKAKLESKRAPKFSQREIETLVDLVSKYKVEIETPYKTPDAKDKRESAWEAVTNGVNAVSAGVASRSVDKIKKKWSQLKSDARRRWVTLKQSRSLSGGAPPIVSERLSDTYKNIIGYSGFESCDDESEGA